jgi:Zn-dependent protease
MIPMLFNSGLSGKEIFIHGSLLIIVLIFSLSIHEIMHGYAAYKLGDDTARLQGRLTLNPLVHLDPFGTIMMLVAGFGWAKPVPVNYSRLTRYKNRDTSIRIVSLAGVTANFLIAILSYLLFAIIAVVGYKSGLITSTSSLGESSPFLEVLILILKTLFRYLYVFNLMLMAFNLLPIPPLDGYHVLETFLPYKWKQIVQGYERYASMIFLLLIVFGNFSGFSPLGWLISTIEIPFKYIIETPINLLFEYLMLL